MVVFDIDSFKAINDGHGHSTGDTAIAEVAKELSAVFGERSLCARIGGEEFAVFSSDVPFAAFAALAETARIRIARLRISADAGDFRADRVRRCRKGAGAGEIRRELLECRQGALRRQDRRSQPDRPVLPV